jgi:serine/threonine protein kinase
VYAGVDADLGRPVASKLVREQVDSEGYRARLLREAQAMARLEHPNVVRVYEIGHDRGRLFVAMELVEGETLTRWLATKRPWREIVEMFAQVGAGLSAVHRVGLVHRDFKPDNVLVDRGGHARVADFGLARLEASQAAASPMKALTHTGAVMGTPGFMAPEQQFGADVDARADQYSYCVALREALGGKDSAAPAPVRAIVSRGLSYDPNERFPSMDELLLALSRAIADKPEKSGRRGVFLAVALAVGVVAAIAVVAAMGSHGAQPKHGVVAQAAPDASVVAPPTMPTTPEPTHQESTHPTADVPASPKPAPKAPPKPDPKPPKVEPKPPAPEPGVGSSQPTITPMPEQHKLPAADVNDPGHITVVRSTIRDLGYDGIDLGALDRDPAAMQAALEAERDAATGTDQLIAKVKLGMVARRRGDCIGAQTLFDEAKAKLKWNDEPDAPWNARAWFGLGLCALATKQDAMPLLQHAWNHGNQDEYFVAAGIAFYENDKHQDALGMFLVAKHKTNARVQAAVARWLTGTGLALP